MNDDPRGCVLSLMLLVVLITSIVLGFVSDSYRDRELIQRGLKAYDQQTGHLKWTEKAGGEKTEIRPAR